MTNKFTKIFIAVVSTVVVLAWITMAVLIFKVIDHVDEHGIKGATERIWCGRNQDCFSPASEENPIK